MNKQKQQGFTLMELIIVIAIIGLLAAIAFPSYQNSTSKARRTDAQAALAGFANAMERHFTNNGTYLGAATGGGNTGAPDIFATQAPVDGSTKFYNLTIQAATATTYTLQAAPIAGTAQAGDGSLRILSTGQKFWDNNNDGVFAATENCWQKSC